MRAPCCPVTRIRNDTTEQIRMGEHIPHQVTAVNWGCVIPTACVEMQAAQGTTSA